MMKRSIYFQYILFVVFVIGASFSQPSKLIEKSKKVIYKSYDKKSFELGKIDFSSLNYESTLNETNFFKIEFADNSEYSYLFLGNAPSQTETFDYMVIFNNDLSIRKIKVLIYRESWGGEIGSNRWLRQFVNANKGDEFIYRKNISAISGATISVKSMTQSINNLLEEIEVLHNNQFF